MKYAHKPLALTLVCAFGLSLSGCGGDSDDDASAPTPAPPAARNAAEGAWCGIASNGNMQTFIALDNGTVWGTFGTGTCASGYTNIGGAYHGTYTANGNSVSGSGQQYVISSATSGTTTNGTFSGTASAKNNLNITLTSPATITLNASYFSPYDQPASLASLAGAYSGQVAGVTPAGYGVRQTSVTISGSTISVPADASGCSASGTLAPHVTSHGTVDVFDLSLKFNGASCVAGNGTTVTGIAVQTASNQMQAMALTPDNSKGLFFVGNRS